MSNNTTNVTKHSSSVQLCRPGPGGISSSIGSGLSSGGQKWRYSLSAQSVLTRKITLIGLQNSGKTTLLHVLAAGEFKEDSIPTVGFNMRKVVKGHVTIKAYDSRRNITDKKMGLGRSTAI